MSALVVSAVRYVVQCSKSSPQATLLVVSLCMKIDNLGLVVQGLNPLSFYAPDEIIPDYGVTFRYTSQRRFDMLSFSLHMHEFVFLLVPLKYDCSYIARDPVGNRKSREAWVYMLVRSPKYWSDIQQNRAPVVLDGSLQTMQGSDVQGTLNATDDFDTLEQMMFTVLEPPSNGEVTLQGNAFDYVPDPGFYGEDTFVFQVIFFPHANCHHVMKKLVVAVVLQLWLVLVCMLVGFTRSQMGWACPPTTAQ